MSSAAAAPVLVVLVAIASDMWVLRDAQKRERQGTPVTFSVGSLTINTPTLWFLGCLLLWVIFFPLYLVSRS